MLRCIKGRMNGGPLPKIHSRSSSSYVKSCASADPDSNFFIQHLKDQGFTFGKTVGEGSYCKVKIVYKSTSERPFQKIACKIIDKRKASDDFVTKFLPRELSIVKDLRHTNIVEVFDVLSMPNHVYIFMDYCEKGDLLDHIRARGALSESQSKNYFRQIVSAIQHLHSLDIAHRDLKCENVLLATKDHVKIADFGFARLCHDPRGRRILSDTFCGSASYAAPEILQGTIYNPKMYDSWSLGCVLFIMLTASMPFDDSNVPSMIRAQKKRIINFSGKIETGSAAWRLILHLLEPDVTRRATIRQVSKSNWLRKVPQ